MSYAYLASPYFHEDPFIMEDRYLKAARALHSLLNKDQWTYSPIVHCHELAKIGGLPKGHTFWLRYDFVMLGSANKLLVLRIDGWDRSVGVAAEIAEAERINIPVEYL